MQDPFHHGLSLNSMRLPTALELFSGGSWAEACAVRFTADRGTGAPLALRASLLLRSSYSLDEPTCDRAIVACPLGAALRS
jgi:hypothetical protein